MDFYFKNSRDDDDRKKKEEEEEEELQRRFRERDFNEEELIDGWWVCHPHFKPRP